MAGTRSVNTIQESEASVYHPDSPRGSSEVKEEGRCVEAVCCGCRSR